MVCAEKAPLTTAQVCRHSTGAAVQRQHRARTRGLLKSRWAAVSVCISISPSRVCWEGSFEGSDTPAVGNSVAASRGCVWVPAELGEMLFTTNVAAQRPPWAGPPCALGTTGGPGDAWPCCWLFLSSVLLVSAWQLGLTLGLGGKSFFNCSFWEQLLGKLLMRVNLWARGSLLTALRGGEFIEQEPQISVENK